MRQLLVVACVLALAGCGRIGFDALASGGDDGGGGGDGGSDGSTVPQPFTLTLLGAPSVGTSIAAAPAGGVVVAGAVSAPFKLGGTSLPVAGAIDIMLASIDADGSIRWVKLFGGVGIDSAGGVAVAPDGTIFLTGAIGSPVDFGGGPLAHNRDDAFVASFTAAGDHRWSHSFGGGSSASPINDVGIGIAVSSVGDVVVSGSVAGAVDFGDGSLTPPSTAARDGFVARFTPDTGGLVWARRWGVLGDNVGAAIAVAGNGEVYAAGYYNGTPDFGGGAAAARGADDAFVLALASDGAYRWDRTFGGGNNDRLYGIALDGNDIVAGGYYWQTTDLPGIPMSAGRADGVVVAYSTAGTPQWKLRYGDSGCDFVLSVRAAAGELAISGISSGTIDLGDGPHTAIGGDSLLFTRSSGGVTWSTVFHGSGDDFAVQTAGDRASGFYVVGGSDLSLDSGCYSAPSAPTGYIRRF
jgi:hypothetical protein